MKKFLSSFLARLTSRKFLLTMLSIGAVVQFPEYSDDIIRIAAVFIGVEGAADVVERYKAAGLVKRSSSGVSDLFVGDSSDPDTSTVVPGN